MASIDPRSKDGAKVVERQKKAGVALSTEERMFGQRSYKGLGVVQDRTTVCAKKK